MYYDAQTNDAQLTVTVLRTAAQFGAVATNYTEVAGFTRDSQNKLKGKNGNLPICRGRWANFRSFPLCSACLTGGVCVQLLMRLLRGFFNSLNSCALFPIIDIENTFNFPCLQLSLNWLIGRFSCF